MAVTQGLVFTPEWLSGEGVAAPEMAATWCRMTVLSHSQNITLHADTRTEDIGTALPVSAYVAAEWFAQHWWLLRAHLRPAALPARMWAWSNVLKQEWLRSHNLRGAGTGMSWPDLTILPEGSSVRLVWNAGPGLAGQPVRFLTSGEASMSLPEFTLVVTEFVEAVLRRLAERGITGTPLQEEWFLIQDSDDEERQFAEAAARLGLDPFNVDEDVTAKIIRASELLPEEVLDEFFDSARAPALLTAAEWVGDAVSKMRMLPHPRLPVPQSWLESFATSRVDAPWAIGYEAARMFRGELGLAPVEALDAQDFIATERAGGDGGGVRGVVQSGEGQSGVVLGRTVSLHPNAQMFAAARALGLGLLRPERRVFLLDPTPTPLARASRAFAAEVLAPAEGVRQRVDGFGGPDADSFEAVALEYGVSPEVIRRQWENQVAA